MHLPRMVGFPGQFSNGAAPNEVLITQISREHNLTCTCLSFQFGNIGTIPIAKQAKGVHITPYLLLLIPSSGSSSSFQLQLSTIDCQLEALPPPRLLSSGYRPPLLQHKTIFLDFIYSPSGNSLAYLTCLQCHLRGSGALCPRI